MSISTNLFDYDLPLEQVAQYSVEPRDHSKLMVLDRETGTWQHKQFFEIGYFLRAEDVLVLNDTKVFRARLLADDGTEIFLLRAWKRNEWETLARPGRRIKAGMSLTVAELNGVVKEKTTNGIVVIEFDRDPDAVIAFANQHGQIPTPPYIKERPNELAQYQTVYAQQTGSVAAPTAGFHFTKRLINELKQKGIQFEFVTLHVGLGTFRPMRTKTLEAHQMHAEFVSISQVVAARINQAKQDRRRVIAVGTTTVRTLEGVAHQFGILRGFTGDIDLFITPGFHFKVIDGLITNFHLPKSTLLVLVSAFAGRENILRAYQEAIKQRYRFYSFGDAVFITI